MRHRLFTIAAGALLGLTLSVTSALAQWPTTCVALNDIVEAHLGNDQNVGLYQRVFGDQAEQACQNDHRDDVRAVFAWAIGSHEQATAAATPPPPASTSPYATWGDWQLSTSTCPAGHPNCWPTGLTPYMRVAAFDDTNESFHDTPELRVGCRDQRYQVSFDGGGEWIGLGDASMSVTIGESPDDTWFDVDRGSEDLATVYFDRRASDGIIAVLRQAEAAGAYVEVGAASDYGVVVADFDLTGLTANLAHVVC